ncbi:MAG TPA: hypothetical protein VH415_09835 [Nitrososphaeraceae archaeon]
MNISSCGKCVGFQRINIMLATKLICPLDTDWAVSLSMAGILANVGIIFFINLSARRSERKSKKLMNFV